MATEPTIALDIPPLALTIPQAAKALGIGERTVEQAIADGRLPVVRFGRRVILPVESLRSWLVSEAQRQTELPRGDDVSP